MSNENKKQYHIEWKIEVEASSPEEAAKLALDIQMDRGGIATIFVVNGQHTIDVEGYKTRKAEGVHKKYDTNYPTAIMH